MSLQKTTLDNGLTVILQPRPAAPVVACNVWIGAGSADESPEEAGVAHVHEHMLFKGTERRGVGEIAREVEASGGRINAFTSFDQTCYFVTMSSRYAETGLDILSDAVANSTFDADELENELEVILEEMKRTRDNPSRVASLKLFETAFEEHPYRRPVIGNESSVGSFEREDVRRFYERHYVPENMALVVTGDFESDELMEAVDATFGSLEAAGDYEPVERPEEPEQREFRGWVDDRPVQQSQLRLGFQIPHATHDDVPALDLLGAILGYGDASHLVQSIERERGLVNSISASAQNLNDAGLMFVSANYQADEVSGHEERVEAILDEIFRFREARVDEHELERARTIIESREIYGKQTAEGLAMKLGRYEMVAGDPGYEQEYYDRLAEVTPEEIREVARRYLTPSNTTAVLLHPDDQEAVTVDDLAGSAERADSTVEREAVGAAVQTDDEGFVRLEIEDGPTLIVQEDHSVETFAGRALSLGGVRWEPAGQNGVNHLLSKLVTRGTAERSAVEISHEVESMAGSLSGLPGRNTTGLSMSGLSRFFEPMFEIFSGCYLGATIPEGEFEREKRIHLEKLEGRRDKLPAVNGDQYREAFFAPHPYGRPKVGVAEEVADLTPEEVRAFHDRVVHPSSSVVSVAGDVDPDRIAGLVERYFVRPDDEKPEPPSIASPADRSEPEMVVGDLDKEQAHVVVGFDAPTLAREDQYAIRMLYAVLSGQGGRLFYELRDRQSLAYSVRARTLLGLDAGTFLVEMGTSPDKIGEAVEGIYDQIARVRDEGVPDEELQRARRYLVGNHDIGLQKNSARALAVGLDELYGLGFKRSLRFREHVDEIDVEDIRRVADEYLDPRGSVVSITKPPGAEVPDGLPGSAIDAAGSVESAHE